MFQRSVLRLVPIAYVFDLFYRFAGKLSPQSSTTSCLRNSVRRPPPPQTPPIPLLQQQWRPRSSVWPPPSLLSPPQEGNVFITVGPSFSFFSLLNDSYQLKKPFLKFSDRLDEELVDYLASSNSKQIFFALNSAYDYCGISFVCGGQCSWVAKIFLLHGDIVNLVV